MQWESLFQQAQKMRQEMQKIQEGLKNKFVEGSAGGGKVIVTANGHQEVVKIRIDPEVVDPDPEEVEFLEDMIVGAVNQALEKSRALAGKEGMQIAGGLDLPSLMKMFSG